MKNLTIFIVLAFTLFIPHIAHSQQTNVHKYAKCGLNQKSVNLAQLIIESNIQQRAELNCNEKLAEIAMLKAKLMSKTNKIHHTIDYITPNQLLRQQGINLPNNYPMFDNQVESIMGAVTTAQDSYDIFLSSPDHKSHLLGEQDFLLKQNQIGVGFFKDDSTKYVYHWVVYITQIIPNTK